MHTSDLQWFFSMSIGSSVASPEEPFKNAGPQQHVGLYLNWVILRLQWHMCLYYYTCATD